MKLSESLVNHLLYLGVESVKIENNKVVGYDLKKGSIKCNLTNRDVGIIIRTWKCCEGLMYGKFKNGDNNV